MLPDEIHLSIRLFIAYKPSLSPLVKDGGRD